MNWYSPDWTGPPSDEPIPGGQVIAIDLLNSFFDSKVDEHGLGYAIIKTNQVISSHKATI